MSENNPFLSRINDGRLYNPVVLGLFSVLLSFIIASENLSLTNNFNCALTSSIDFSKQIFQ